ncbi:RNA 2',3'-cyclic phosphodiesterase [uncultured Sphingomonas sp.]|uniref:RNA 2',3'-cyclic phosphodiesterase n=1 Tax=uncultured Sphingomonas sp. TaxID=158754 RepID=UPI0035CC17F7
MHRLFVALRPPLAIRALLGTVMNGVAPARWQDDDQLHLTLRYIGEVERPVAEDVAALLGQVHGAAPCIALSGTGTFAKDGRADTLWAGVTPHGALAALHHKVDQAVVRAGLPPDRRAYLPHITLARIARRAGDVAEIARWRADTAALTSDPFTLDHLTLFESHLGRSGASYEPVERWRLVEKSGP